jgi:hypothetical protein
MTTMQSLSIASVLMMASLHDPAAAAQSTACAPQPEWGVTKTFAKWRVSLVCSDIQNLLSVEAASEGVVDRGFAFICDKERGVGGWVTVNKIDLHGPVSLTFKGGPGPSLALNGFGSAIGSMVQMEASPATKRFEAALVDGPGPTFTLVVTPRDKSPLEMTFSRAGLAAAVKPLRRQCAW